MVCQNVPKENLGTSLDKNDMMMGQEKSDMRISEGTQNLLKYAYSTF